MSATSALKGYRTQFLYSLHYILKNRDKNLQFRLEGEEDLDILNGDGNLLYAIQIKNLTKQITLSDILKKDKTSFFRRFIENYQDAIPMLVSFGSISEDLKKLIAQNDISNKVKQQLQGFNIKEQWWKTFKDRVVFIEVDESETIQGILQFLKQYSIIDPEPTAEILLYWLQTIAEKQVTLASKDLFKKIEDIALYLSQRIAITEQYGIVLRPLHKVRLDNIDTTKANDEFCYGISAKYNHILLGLDIIRENLLDKITSAFKKSNIVILHGASGQGKTTLAYRYAHNYSPELLAYELNLPCDPISTNKAILSIESQTKHLNTPILFIINVKPNTTEWLKVVGEFSNLKDLKFLIAIRQEDWFNASSKEINFLHEDIELYLNRNEAELIYNNLNSRKPITHYADFDESWIKHGNNAPLLEFVYSITFGDSLKSKLKHQILQIANGTNSESQLDLLRMVSLADSLNAKIDLSYIQNNSALQFVIEKCEKEYLLKKSDNKKHLIGLHPVRSKIMVEILFDEFVIEKRDYLLKCISTIEASDVYLFLIQCYHQNLLTPNQVLLWSRQINNLTWTSYNGLNKSFMWVGIRDYIEDNISILDNCHNLYGDAWMFLVDLFHGNTFNFEEFLKESSLPQNLIDTAEKINAQLSPKENTYKYVKQFFDSCALPSYTPIDSAEWLSFSELLFWLSQIPNTLGKISHISDKEFNDIFQTLPIYKLSKLMLGMFYYSEIYNEYRLKYAPNFVDRIRHELRIPVLKIDEKITANFIENLQGESGLSPYEHTIEIIGLLRNAFPDKTHYNSQGYGHRMAMLPTPHDETHKIIPVNNLPLEEWVNINAISNRIYDFQNRPKDWMHFYQELAAWETAVYNLLIKMQKCISSYFQNNLNHLELIPILENVEYSFSNLTEPQSISDPLGIYAESGKTEGIQKWQEILKQLKTKHSPFLKQFRNFKNAIECFINQSAITILKRYDRKNLEENERLANLSQINLYNAIEAYELYEHKKIQLASKFGHRDSVLITQELLISCAYYWKDYLNSNIYSNNISVNKRFNQLKKDFETKINKECKAYSKNSNYEIAFRKDATTEYKPVILFHTSNPIYGLQAIEIISTIFKSAIGDIKYTSLKQLMLNIHFSKLYVIVFVDGKTIDNNWYELPLYFLEGRCIDELQIYYRIPKPIDKEIIKTLRIKKWSERIPKILDIETFKGEFAKVRLYVEHICDLQFFDEIELDEIGNKIAKKHILEINEKLHTSFQFVIDFLAIEISKFDENLDSSDELEQIYLESIDKIKNTIFPTQKGNEIEYEVKMNLELLKAWAERLIECTIAIEFFTQLLVGKYILKYKI